MGSQPHLSAVSAFIFLLILSAGPPPSAAKLSTFLGIFGPFNKPLYYNSILHFELPATTSNEALQITPDSASDGFNLSSLSGRVLLRRSFKLWQNSNPNSTIASFNISFLVNIYHVDNSTLPGEGLTFLLAPSLSLPPNSYGQYLGLTNSTTDGDPSNKILAVELDTFKNEFDPDANHIGLNINSIRSNITASLTPLGYELCPKNKANFFVVWVQYDGVEKVIDVYIAQQENKTGPTPARPAFPVIRSSLDLRTMVSQSSYFGFSASTGDATELNCILRWNLTVEHFTENNNDNTLAVTVSTSVLSFAVALVVGAVLWHYHKKRGLTRTRSNLVGALNSLPGMPREFKFKELKKATDNFDEKNKLGAGAYGVVYRGNIPREDLEVAVKWFLRENIKGEDDFLSELTIINRLRHRNLVRLLGWCHKNNKLLLVYDYMPNGSLDQHLFACDGANPLNWETRYKIINGVASALHYLHDEYDQKVVHRDLKASNILLDKNFNARLGDFGLARALDNEKTSYAEAEGVRGTMGYIAPECFHTGKATRHSDIYAFGAVLLEVVCGQRPGARIGGYPCLADWVWSLHRDGRLLDAVDSKIGMEYVADMANRILLLGLACCHPISAERPKTDMVVQMISGSVQVPHVPPFKPSFIWPSIPIMDDNSSQATMTETRSFTTSEWTPRMDGYADGSDKFDLV